MAEHACNDDDIRDFVTQMHDKRTFLATKMSSTTNKTNIAVCGRS